VQLFKVVQASVIALPIEAVVLQTCSTSTTGGASGGTDGTVTGTASVESGCKRKTTTTGTSVLQLNCGENQAKCQAQSPQCRGRERFDASQKNTTCAANSIYVVKEDDSCWDIAHHDAKLNFNFDEYSDFIIGDYEALFEVNPQFQEACRNSIDGSIREYGLPTGLAVCLKSVARNICRLQ
jgi:hypothetical protein